MAFPVYIWQKADWPNFVWDADLVVSRIGQVRLSQGRLIGQMEALGFDVQGGKQLEAMTQEVVASAAIEGVSLDVRSVRSSVARHLGLDVEGLPEPDHYTEGVVQVMVDAVHRCGEPLSEERLCGWHAALFPTGYSGPYKITVGSYRQGQEPMQVVSGAMGKERVHYEAPPSALVPAEMERFLQWANSTADMDNVLKAAIAHLWFVSIHPFDDGNGRLCRTISDFFMARSDGQARRYYSLSAEINRRKKSYYEALEQAQHGTTDITAWVLWFLDCVESAIGFSEDEVSKVLRKSRFWDGCGQVAFNERQRKVLTRLLDGFEGKMTTSKWAKIAHCSSDTALRDITDLVAQGVMKQCEGGGRNTSYMLVVD